MNQDSKSRTTSNKPERDERTPATDHSDDKSLDATGGSGTEASTAKPPKTGGRYGANNSMETVGTIEFKWRESEDVEQDAIRWIGNAGCAMDNKIDIKPHEVTFSDRLRLPDMSGRTTGRTYSSSVPLVYEAGGTFQPFVIRWAGSRFKALYDDSVFGLPPDSYDLVTGGIMCEVSTSEFVRDVMYTSIHRGSNIIADFSGFFTIAYMYAMHLEICAENKINLNRRPYNPDNFTFINLATTAEAEPEVATRWTKAAEEFMIFFRDSRLTLSMRELLIVLTLGGPDADPPAAGQPLNPITSAYTYPSLKFAIWDDKEPIAWPGRVQITANEVRSAINSFAAILGAEDDLSIGFCRASTFLITRVVPWPLKPGTHDAAVGELGKKMSQIRLSVKGNSKVEVGPSSTGAGGPNRPVDHNGRTIVTGLLEVGSGDLYRPLGLNPIYDLLRIARPSGATNMHLYDEGRFLQSSLYGDRLVKVQFLLGAALSVVASSIFDLGNFTARELNNWAKGEGMPSTGVLSGIFWCTQGRERASFYDIVAGSATLLYPYKFNTFSIGAVGYWSLICQNLGANTERILWQGSWGRHVPYIIRPETQGWQYVGWADIWGITGNGPRVDFRRDLIREPSGRGSYYLFSINEPQYRERAASSGPYVRVNYGLFMCSMFWQLSRTLPMARVSFRRMHRSLEGECDPNWYTDGYQPQLEEDQFRVVPGTFPTYDWVEERVLVPGFRIEDCDKNTFWRAADMASRHFEWVGVVRENEVPFGWFDVRSVMKGVVVGDRYRSLYQKESNK